MKIAIIAGEGIQHQLPVAQGSIEFVFYETMPEPEMLTNYQGLIHCHMDSSKHTYAAFQLPIFINSVCDTLQQHEHPQQVVRFNGWPVFFEKALWEVSGSVSKEHEQILHNMGKQWINVPDVSGFISCRVIAMIINEAFFALESGVSSKEDMNIAMKLGTNYPMGPFEWAERIGVSNIVELLSVLSVSDDRYKPCTLLQNNK